MGVERFSDVASFRLEIRNLLEQYADKTEAENRGARVCQWLSAEEVLSTIKLCEEYLDIPESDWEAKIGGVESSAGG